MIKMMKPLLSLFLLAALLTACSNNVVLDNPRRETVTFIFDGNNAHTLPPNSMAEISLDPGNHTVKVTAMKDEVLFDTTFSLKEGGVVHSGSSTYLVWRQLYGLQTDRATLLNEDWVEFDSARAFADLKVFPANALYIEKTWDYGLADPMPESQTLMVSKDFIVESKIFRAKDFLDAYRAMKAP